MKNKGSLLIAGLLSLFIVTASTSGCVSTSDGKAIVGIEEMSDLEYNKWRLYLQLGVKIGASRLAQEGMVDQAELDLAAGILDALREQNIVTGGESFIQLALVDAGFTNDEVAFLLLVVEQEIIARTSFDPTTGMVVLSERTKELLQIVANSLRQSTMTSSEEEVTGRILEEELNGRVIRDVEDFAVYNNRKRCY